MKSHLHLVDGYAGVAVACLSDIHSYLGTPDLAAERDNDRLLSLIGHTGLGFLTLTLPSVGKIFDRALSDGCLPLISEPGFGSKVKGSILPVFLQDAWMRVFEPDGRVLETPDFTAIACLRQLFYCFKKARLTCDPKRITSTIIDFIEVDEALPRPGPLWSDPLGIGDGLYDEYLNDVHLGDSGSSAVMDSLRAVDDCQLSDRAYDILQFVCDVVSADLGVFDPYSHAPRHGRGAVADLQLGKAFKYAFPCWSERLESVFPLADFGFPNYGMWADAVRQGDLLFQDREVPGRMICVPKDMKGPRLIAAEPTSSQYCQQNILAYLVQAVHQGKLRDVVNFRDQSINQMMALDASRWDCLATIDLSHASDSVSCAIVERVFRRNKGLLQALVATRTSSVELPESGVLVQLNKFSTMGAATTFPVQTIFYACVCIAMEMYSDGVHLHHDAVKRLVEAKWESHVFGDDIIAPVHVAKSIVQLLKELGFSVNPTKTFLGGNFKESCGVDAYRGVDVTPTYVLDLFDASRPSTLASVRECSNNLHLAGWWKTAHALVSTVPLNLRKKVPVVNVNSGSPGWVSYTGEDTSHLKKRWNESYHRYEFRMADVSMSAQRHSPGGSASLLQYFLEAPDPKLMTNWSSGYDERPGLMVRTRWVPSVS